ncbi:hypothetical protein ACETK8_20450 (plasmid) [Brevundimonas staleyi]|uniref:Uncharacterized protein n=1 Tax=Brevundimonas staleyi TaxID=74326 RepID=A0ABW0FQ69_9CAUL
MIRSADNEALARQAGANAVINPASFAGQLLASSSHGAHVADYMADLAAIGGAVSLCERQVTAAEVGMPLSAIRTGIGVQLHRGGQAFGFDSVEAQALKQGDTILEIISRDPSSPAARAP